MENTKDAIQRAFEFVGIKQVTVTDVLEVTVLLSSGDRNNETLRRLVYDAEWDLMERFPNTVFDFKIKVQE